MAIDLTDESVKAEVIGTLKKEGLIIRTADEDSSFVDSKTSEATKNLEAQYKQPLFDAVKLATGYEGSNETPDNLIKNAFGLMKTGHESALEKVNTDFLALKEKVDKNEPAVQLVQDQFEQYKVDAKTKEDGYLTQIKTLNDSSSLAVKNSEISAAFAKHSSKLSDEKHTKELAKMKADNFGNAFTREVIDNKVIWKDSNGTIQQSQQDGTALTADQIMDTLLSDLYDTKRVQTGAGSGKGGDGEGQELHLPDNVKDQMQLAEYIEKEMGIDPKSDKMAETFAKFKKEYPKLPIRLR